MSPVLRTVIILARVGLALVGAVAIYVLVYGGSGWLADSLGYETPAGRFFAFVNGGLSLLAFGFASVFLFAVVLFWMLTKYAFVKRDAA
jgi:hypothetical protein